MKELYMELPSNGEDGTADGCLPSLETFGARNGSHLVESLAEGKPWKPQT